MNELVRFCTRYDIRGIRLDADRDIRDAEASLVTVRFGPAADEVGQGFEANFKLLECAAGIHRHVRAIGAPPECFLEPAAAGQELAPAELERRMGDFLAAIRPRVAQIHREQSILDVRPVGRSYALASGTRFKVLSDDGEGLLTIRLMHVDGSHEASLAADDLLNGLHTGLITPD